MNGKFYMIKSVGEILDNIDYWGESPPGWSEQMEKWCEKGPFEAFGFIEERGVRMCRLRGVHDRTWSQTWVWRESWLTEANFLEDSLFEI